MKTIWILLVDSVRMLRSQKMFWVVLGLSALVALIYASIGINEKGVSVCFGLWTLETELLDVSADGFKAMYLAMFTEVIVRFWLSLIAIALALISCASIFPGFVAEGSVALVVSKPPSRLVLFLGKYLGSLLFVFVQVLLFTLIVFLAFGFRFGEWNFTVFWAVPVVVFIFSLIYSVHVLVSVWSGSVVFGLLAAFAVWGLGVLSEWTENITYKMVYLMPQIGMQMDMVDGGQEETEPQHSTGTTGETVYSVINGVRMVMPKTRVASNQLGRLIKVGGEGENDLARMLNSIEENNQAEAVERFERRHPIWRDILSSTGFELVFVGLAAMVFCRRDY